MRTLAMVLCCLLMLAPAEAQQVVPQTAPHFYVPYGIRGVSLPLEQESSSSKAQFSEPYVAALDPPAPQPPQMRRRHPMRGRRFGQYGPPCCTPPSPPPVSANVALIIGALVVGFIVAGAVSDH